ncbi:MAG: nucleotide exchange factor GrpE [Clostridia bacterium]|nr:nucleotide exchange factor GrpE [Clostridia bacterium]
MNHKKHHGIDHAEKIESDAAAEAREMPTMQPKGEAAFDEAAQMDASVTADANFELTAELARIEELEKKLEETEAKLKDAERLRLLALADMDNQRKRTAKEMENVRYNTTQDTVFPFLQVFDHFSMAVAAAEKSSSFESMLQGMEIIQKEFDKAFSDLDITVIDASVKPLDPAVHEAVAEEHSDTVPAGTVLRQWSRGYRCGTRLLKPAMVVVSSGPAEAAEDAKKDAE